MLGVPGHLLECTRTNALVRCLCLHLSSSFVMSADLSMLLDALDPVCHVAFSHLNLLLPFRTLLSVFHPDDLPEKRLITDIQERTNTHHRECDPLDDSHNEEPIGSRNLVSRP